MDVGAERRDVDEALDARRLGQPRQPRRALDVDGFEGLAAALVENADAANHGVGTGNRRHQPRLVTDAGIDERDLADIAQRAQEPGIAGVPAHHRHDRPLGRQPLDDVAADETRAAEDGSAP